MTARSYAQFLLACLIGLPTSRAANAQCFQFSSGKDASLTIVITNLPAPIIGSDGFGDTTYDYTLTGLSGNRATVTVGGVSASSSSFPGRSGRMQGAFRIQIISGPGQTLFRLLVSSYNNPGVNGLSAEIQLAATDRTMPKNPPGGLLPNGLPAALPPISAWGAGGPEVGTPVILAQIFQAGTPPQLPLVFTGSLDTIGSNCASDPDCSKQVEVSSFTACAWHDPSQCPSGTSAFTPSGPGLRQNLEANILLLLTDTVHPVWGPYPGVRFLARVHIIEGAIPVDSIHIRYINNLVAYNGRENYDPLPNESAVLGPGATFPLLDWDKGFLRKSPYYGSFPEEPATGADRTLEASDSPILSALIIREHPKRRLQSIDVVKGFTMYLGCTTSDDDLSKFRTLATLDWTADFSGNVTSQKPFVFKVSNTAGVLVRPSQPSQTLPTMKPPVANGNTGFYP